MKKLPPVNATRVNASWVVQEDHGAARANAEQGSRYVNTSDDDNIPDDSISILD